MDTLHSKLVGAAELLGPDGSTKDFIFMPQDVVHFIKLARKFIQGPVSIRLDGSKPCLSDEIDGEVMVFLLERDKKVSVKITHIKPKKEKSDDIIFRSWTGQLPLPHKCIFDPPLTAEVLKIMAAAIND